MSAAKIERNAKVRRGYAAGETVRQLSERFGVSRTRIEQIVHDRPTVTHPKRPYTKRHDMAPYPHPLPLATRVIRTLNSCRCPRCRDWRQVQAVVTRDRISWQRSKTGAFELAAYPHINSLIDALASHGTSHTG